MRVETINQGYSDGAFFHPQKNEAEIVDSNFFDLEAFFDEKDVPESEADLLVTLRDDANNSIATLTSRVTAETFALGASLTSGVFSALGSLVGSCSGFCVHTLGSLANISNFSLGSSFNGLSIPGFAIDGNVAALSQITGISPEELLAGKFSAEDILLALFSNFGSGISLIFGVGFFEMICGNLFDAFLPNSV